jgi:hypothetical protein
MLNRYLKLPFKLLSFFIGLIAVFCLIFFSFYQFQKWKSNQHYEEEITFNCRHKSIDCANENLDFEVLDVKNNNFLFLKNNMVSLRWKNNKNLDDLSNSKDYLTKDFAVKGIVYKYKFDAAVSPLYDCELEAYRVDVIEMKPI